MSIGHRVDSLSFALSRGALALAFAATALFTGQACDCDDILNPIGEPDGGLPIAPLCVPADADCESNQAFRHGQCGPAGCEVDADCCPGTRCRAELNTCWPHQLDSDYSCEVDADCDDPAMRCKEVSIGGRDPLPTCVFDRCDVDADCGASRTCFHSVCVDGSPCGEGCADGEVCDVLTGTCAAVPANSVGCSAACDGLRVLSDPDSMAGEVCCESVCECFGLPPIVPKRYGRYADVAIRSAGEVVVSAYDAEYGDLVLIRYTTAGEQHEIRYVDGVPAGAPVVADDDGPRGGVREVGPNVGTHTSIAVDSKGLVRMAYHDVDNRALRVAVEIAGGYARYELDQATDLGEDSTSDVGLFTDVTIDETDDTVWVAYTVVDTLGAPGLGGPASGLKVARSLTPEPQSANDWQVFWVDFRPAFDPCGGVCGPSQLCVLDGEPVCKASSTACPDSCSGTEKCAALDEPDDMGNTAACFPPGLPPAAPGFPRGRGLHPSIIVDNGELLVAHYDSVDGDLRLSRVAADMMTDTVVIDGDGEDGRLLGDVGRHPGLSSKAGATAIAYSDFSRHQLKLWRGSFPGPGTFAVIDDGIVEEQPGLHFVGAGASMVAESGKLYVAYQDASQLDLKLAVVDGDAVTTSRLLVDGAHGFYSGMTHDGASAFVVSLEARLDDRQVERSKLSLLPLTLE